MSTINGILGSLSNELVAAVQRGGQSVVRVDDGTSLTASGIVWNAEGVIVSTSHGVESDDGVYVEDGEGRRFEATVVGRDPESDIAVLKVNTDQLAAFEQAEENGSVGTLALALGRPGQAGLQATFGMVGSIAHEGNVLYADATLYPGFSGGALVDSQGRLLGILNLSFGRGRGAALAIPVLSRVVGSLLDHGSVPRGYLGIGTQPVELSGQLQQRLGLSQGGLVVVSVEADSPADQAGLLVGDVITGIGEEEVSDPRQLRHLLGRQAAGSEISIKLVRGGRLETVAATLGARSGAASDARRHNGRRHERGRRGAR